MSARPSTITPIQRGDIERKLRELQGGVTETTTSAANTLVTVGAVVAVGIVAVAFILGRRKGKQRRTIVEVRRF